MQPGVSLGFEDVPETGKGMSKGFDARADERNHGRRIKSQGMNSRKALGFDPECPTFLLIDICAVIVS